MAVYGINCEKQITLNLVVVSLVLSLNLISILF